MILCEQRFRTLKNRSIIKIGLFYFSPLTRPYLNPCYNIFMYYLYILECADETLYTGITLDLARRLNEHNSSPRAAKYTRARRPVKLVYAKKFRSRSLAQSAESRLKKLSRTEKLSLIAESPRTLK